MHNLLRVMVGLMLLVSLVRVQDARSIQVCEAHAAAPTFQEGQEVPCQVDLSGNQRTNVSIASATIQTNPNTNIASVGGVAVPTGNLPVIIATSTNSIGSVVNATGTNSIGSVLQGTSPWTVGGSVNATITNTASITVSVGAVNATLATSSNQIGFLATSTNNIGNVTVTGLSGGALNATITNSSAVPASVAIAGCVVSVCAAPGQTTMASSTSVAIATDQTAVPIAGKISTTLPTPGSNAANISVMTDKFGRMVMVPQADRSLIIKGHVNIATTTESTLIAAGGANVFNDITALSCSNRDAASATRVDIRDSSGGTIQHSMTLNSTGGGFTLPYFVPLPQTTANATWTAQLSVNVSVDCNYVGLKNQ